MKEHLI